METSTKSKFENVKDRERNRGASIFGIRFPKPNALLPAKFNRLFGTDAMTAQARRGDLAHGIESSQNLFAASDAPDGQVDHFHVAYGETAIGNVLDNEVDPNGDAVSAVLAVGPAKGTISLKQNGAFRYVPDQGFFGLDRFWCQIDDVNGHSEQVEVCVFVDTPPNLVPGAEDDFYSTGYGQPVTGEIMGDDSGSNGNGFANLLEEPAHGRVTAKNNGTFEYMPDEGFSGTDSFVYRIVDTDSRGAVVIVSIDVAAPSANNG